MADENDAGARRGLRRLMGHQEIIVANPAQGEAHADNSGMGENSSRFSQKTRPNPIPISACIQS
jgi:hypothetical protein